MKLLFLLFLLSCSTSKKNLVTALPVKDIQKEVKGSRIALCDCYLTFAERKVISTVYMDFEIDKMGTVQKAQAIATSNPINPEGHSCFKKVLKSMSFDKPPGGGSVKVRQPMIFECE